MAIKNKLIKYFKDDNIFDKDGNILSDAVNTLLESSMCKENISIEDLTKRIITLKNNYKKIDLLELFTLVDVNKLDICNIVTLRDISIKEQVLFTYSLQSYIDKYFPQLTFIIEEDFLLNNRFGKFYIGTSRGPRVDILFESLRLIIEFDEKQHSTLDHTEADIKRDELINVLGYKVIRIKYNDDFINFFKNELKDIIEERYFLLNPDLLEEYITSIFVKSGFDEQLIKILISEQCTEVIDGVAASEVGMTPRNMTTDTIFDFLQIKRTEPDFLNDLIENLESCDYPSVEMDNEIILSPNAFEYLLAQISADDYPQVLACRRLYIEMKNTFIHYIHSTGVKYRQLYEDTMSSISILSNNAYTIAKKELHSKNNKLIKENERLQESLRLYEENFELSLPRNNKGIIRAPLHFVSSVRIHMKPLIPEIPELVYSSNNNDIILPMKNDILKSYIDHNIRRFKFNNKKIGLFIKDIKEKLGIFYNPNRDSDYIPHCKLLPFESMINLTDSASI